MYYETKGQGSIKCHVHYIQSLLIIHSDLHAETQITGEN